MYDLLRKILLVVLFCATPIICNADKSRDIDRLWSGLHKLFPDDNAPITDQAAFTHTLLKYCKAFSTTVRATFVQDMCVDLEAHGDDEGREMVYIYVMAFMNDKALKSELDLIRKTKRRGFVDEVELDLPQVKNAKGWTAYANSL